MQGLANDLFNGNMNLLTDEINRFCHSVSAHLNPIDTIVPHTEEIVPHEYTIGVEEVLRKLMSNKLSKGSGPDNIRNWVLRDLR